MPIIIMLYQSCYLEKNPVLAIDSRISSVQNTGFSY